MTISSLHITHAPLARLARRARVTIAQGGLIAYPTSSCFGLGCDPSNRRALKKLLALKGRPQNKGFIIISNDFSQFRPYLQPVHNKLLEPAFATWPGPHTWLLPASSKAMALLKGKHPNIAVRVEGHSSTRRLLSFVKQPLVSTSANPSGKHPYKTGRDCHRRFGKNVLILPGRVGRNKTPSSIHDLTTGQKIR